MIRVANLIGKAARAVPLVLRYWSLLESQYFPPERLAQMQCARLRELLRQAARVPFYAKHFGSGTAPEPGDLASFPPVAKSELLQAPVDERLLPGSRPARLLSRFTSGSTGEPFTVLLTPREKDARVLVELRMLHAHGVGPRDLVMAFRRMSDVGPGGRLSFLGMFPRCFGSMNLGAREQLDLLRRTAPAAVKAHVNSLVAMSDLLLSEGGEPVPGLRLIISCGEYLGEPMRTRIEKAFGVPVADQYGTVEFGFLAWECPERNGLHVNAEDFLIELVGENGQSIVSGSDPGEIVVTSLLQQTMPLIRYHTGDVGQWVDGACPCGRTLPRLRILQGRTADVILRPDGTKMNPLFFTCICEGLEGVLRFQIVQEALDTIRLSYIGSASAIPASVENVLRRRIAAELGESVNVIVERVSHLESGPGGKLKFVRSRLTSST